MEAIIQPCLSCGDECVVEKEEWIICEAPAALCDECLSQIYQGAMPWPMIRMLYVLRCQVASLNNEKELMKRDIRRVFTAQQDMEQSFLTSARV